MNINVAWFALHFKERVVDNVNISDAVIFWADVYTLERHECKQSNYFDFKSSALIF